MATANDLIEASLREIGVLAAGESAAYDDAGDALETLNRLIDQWATERLKMYTVTRTTWTISANDGSYTVGSGGDVDVARPVFVDHVNFIDTSQDPDLEMELNPLTEDAYARIGEKADTSTYPTAYYYNPTYSSGLATLELYPIPTSSDLEGALYARAHVSQFAALTTTVSLPPGYERMIVKELAIELAPSYNRQPSPLLLQQASQARNAVERANVRLLDMRLDSGAIVQSQGGVGYSILRG